MTWLLLTTLSSSFGGFVHLQAPTAALKEGVCWMYAIMMPKKIFFCFRKRTVLVRWFHYFGPSGRPHLVVLCRKNAPRSKLSASECLLLTPHADSSRQKLDKVATSSQIILPKRLFYKNRKTIFSISWWHKSSMLHSEGLLWAPAAAQNHQMSSMRWLKVVISCYQNNYSTKKNRLFVGMIPAYSFQ